jgi:ribosomal protein S18 acetylase RimI-like enzyme
LREDDRDLVQTFECGPTRYQGDVARWIKKWIWGYEPSERGETIIGLDSDANGLLVGYGTWKLVEVGDRGQHIEIAWFGIDSRYQGTKDDRGRSVAGLLYATVEHTARSESGDALPLTLVCHVDNEHALGFWTRKGYRLIEDAEIQIEDDEYYRMVR